MHLFIYFFFLFNAFKVCITYILVYKLEVSPMIQYDEMLLNDDQEEQG